jgi:hypothetical protein
MRAADRRISKNEVTANRFNAGWKQNKPISIGHQHQQRTASYGS